MVQATPANWPQNHKHLGRQGWSFLLPTVTPEDAKKHFPGYYTCQVSFCLCKDSNRLCITQQFSSLQALALSRLVVCSEASERDRFVSISLGLKEGLFRFPSQLLTASRLICLYSYLDISVDYFLYLPQQSRACKCKVSSPAAPRAQRPFALQVPSNKNYLRLADTNAMQTSDIHNGVHNGLHNGVHNGLHNGS